MNPSRPVIVAALALAASLACAQGAGQAGSAGGQGSAGSTGSAGSAQGASGATAAGASSAPATVAPITVAQALQAKDDTDVVLEGTITRQLRGERYEFADVTGTITIEVEDDAWPAGGPLLGTRVRLHGEVERRLISRQVEVEVERVEPLK